jgi:hypothetical protein
MQNPIFIFWTRSFWLAALGVGALLASDVAAIKAFAEVISWFTDYEAEALAAKAIKVAPAVLFIASLHQRSGAARPYTLNPKALK